jgi:hypothetical protein
MLVGKKEYGTWKNGSSVYKDTKGYYVVAVGLNTPMYKKYLKGWKPEANDPELCFVKRKWTVCKKKKSKAGKTRKERRSH